MCGAAASCASTSSPSATCSASNGKAGSSETDTEAVESNKWCVVNVVFVVFAQYVHILRADVSYTCLCMLFCY